MVNLSLSNVTLDLLCPSCVAKTALCAENCLDGILLIFLRVSLKYFINRAFRAAFLEQFTEVCSRLAPTYDICNRKM